MYLTLGKKLRLFCAAIAAFSAVSLAQSTTQGGITGTVFDPTDAIVPNAAIVIHNDGTNAEQKLASDSKGFFKAPQLAPGTYTVTISAPGFSELRSSGVMVEVNRLTELNQHLQTGSATTLVEVTATEPVLNFESADYGGHLSNFEIESIPINNRRWSALALTTPGVTPSSDGFGLLSFRAISPLLNNVEIDGADDNQAFFSEERGRTRAGYSTSQAAVREFQVNTGVYSAEFGRAVGGVVNSVTKSGSNALHGELYFYNRNSSRSAFQPFASNTTFDGVNYITAPYRPKDNRNQYGFGVGGPIIKDRLFWFYAFDQFKRNFPGTAKANNPAAFFTQPNSALPATQTCNRSDVVAGGRTVANAGTITTTGTTTASGSSVNNQACLLAARLGYSSYTAGANAYNAQLQAFLPDLGSVPRFGDQTINTPKLDWQISGKHHLSALYHRLRWNSPGGVQTQATNNYAIDSFGADFVKLDYGVAILESLFTPRLTNELRYQYGRELNNEGRQSPSAYTQQNLTNSTGVPTYVSLLSSSGNIGFNFGTPYYSFRLAYPDERKWQIGDTASLLLGKHSIKFGEDFVHNYDLQNNLFDGNGVYNYTSSIVNYFSDLLSKGGKTCNAAGSGVGSAASGAGFYPCYNSFVQGFGPAVFDLSTQDYGVFVQDDWKATPRLTVNLGVRYDYEKLPQPFTALATLPQTSNQPSDKNNVSPRVGFAWDPFGLGKTVLRGGYGFYYGRVLNAYLLNTYYNTGSPSSQSTYSFSPTTSGAPLLPGVAGAPPPPSSVGPNIQYFDKHFQNPYAQQFDLAVQQDLGHQTVLSLSYIGALGRELPNYLNVNLNPANTYNFNYVVGGANANCGPLTCGSVVPVKVYSNRTQTGTAAGTYIFNTPNPAYGSTTEVISNINSNYHALTVEVQKRASKILSFDAHYTWAHALDFNQNASTGPGTNGWFDPFGNARANYGNSSNDVRQRVVAWAVLNSPSISSNSAVKYLANGWSLKPLWQMQSGLPYSLNVTGTVPNQCYVAGCFEANSSGVGGTGVSYLPLIGRNTYRNPRTINVDLRVQKDFTFAEKYNLQLLGEAFNLANHQNVTGINSTGYSLNTSQTNPAAPTSTLNYQSGPTGFGSVNAANSNNAYQVRQIQLALRLVF